MNQVITFSADLTADSASRTVSGKIVPLNVEAGSTNMGKVIFASGSINIEDPKAIKLLSQHDAKKPLGRMVSFSESENSIDAVFSISRSQRGTEALILAEEGLQSGLSIGAEVLKSKIKDGVTYVSAARLVEVSLVTEPAFKSAQVTDIAAEESDAEESTQPTESETAVENTTPAVEATPVEAPAVEAARPTVSAAYYTKPRIELTTAKYVENTIRAAMGDDSARQYIALECARAVGIPAYFLGADVNTLTYTNAVSERKSLIDFSLRNIMTSIEERLSQSDFVASNTVVRFNFDDFLRGSALERAQIYEILNRIGAISVEEIRRDEDLIR